MGEAPVLALTSAPQSPQVTQNGGHWTIFGPAGAKYVALEPDPGGKYMWLSDAAHNSLVRMTMSGSVKAYPLTGSGGSFTPGFFSFGPGGNIYIGGCIVSACNTVGIFSPKTGHFATYPVPSGDGPGTSDEFVAGPDGNVWFTERAHVANISPQGAIKEYATPDYPGVNIVVGGDHNIWFDGQANSDVCGNYSGSRGSVCPWVSSLVPSTGVVTQYFLGIYSSSYFSAFEYLDGGMTVGADGDVYVLVGATELFAYVYLNVAFLDNVAPDGDQSSVRLGLHTHGSTQYALAAGPPSGAFWWGAKFRGGSGLLNLEDGGINKIQSPDNSIGLVVVAAPDGNMWSIDAKGNVAVYLLSPIVVKPPKVILTKPGATATLTVTYSGNSTLTATSSAPGIATVKPDGTLQYLVTGVHKGSTTIVIRDTMRNSFTVPVTVE
jgi:streptogramin lyase